MYTLLKNPSLVTLRKNETRTKPTQDSSSSLASFCFQTKTRSGQFHEKVFQNQKGLSSGDKRSNGDSCGSVTESERSVWTTEETVSVSGVVDSEEKLPENNLNVPTESEYSESVNL